MDTMGYLSRRFTTMPIGAHEIRITKVYTVEANEFSSKHDLTPNWRENGTPAGGLNTFNLRIEAEAGESVLTDNPTYSLIAKARCLSNPAATAQLPGHVFNPPNLFVAAAPVVFASDGWEYQASEEKYTRTWSIAFPVTAVLVPLVGGGPNSVPQVNEIYQFFVTLIDPAATNKSVACCAVSEPFLLL